ncbi:helix-hairpin-helix domain-containing protein [Bacillus solitudinis]|uniref:helix-hairpin-helix domain-containing protein n=1 Tax=Bacillus solitudinis TaxID=2014074 RepID=UPI000C242207|nr:helix-hairpin-helix domain-containing protein [Bacillus solitudinis]
MNFTKREQILMTLSGITILLVSLVLFLSFGNHSKLENAESDYLFLDEVTEDEQEDSIETDTTIVIDVKGAVNKPGVYEVQNGSRMFEVIEQAEGFTENADQKRVNLASILEDEVLIYVPEVGEEMEESALIEQEHSKGNEGKLAINQASPAEFEALPGIGPAKANAIVSYREEHGPFNEIEDLLKVSGIGSKSFEQLRELIKIK